MNGRRRLISRIPLQMPAAFLFLYAAGIKIMEGPSPTTLLIATLGFEGHLALALATGLPFFEICIGLWLFCGWRNAAAAGACFCVLLIYVSSLVLIGSRSGWSAPCTCTGYVGNSIIASVIIDLVLAGLMFASLRLSDSLPVRANAQFPTPTAP